MAETYNKTHPGGNRKTRRENAKKLRAAITASRMHKSLMMKREAEAIARELKRTAKKIKERLNLKKIK